MNKEIYEEVRNNPKFSELVKKRTGFILKLSLIIFVMYFSFIMLIAFSPETLGQSIGNSVTSVGIPIGLSIIIISIILTRIYIVRANNEYDRLIDDIKDDIRCEP